MRARARHVSILNDSCRCSGSQYPGYKETVLPEDSTWFRFHITAERDMKFDMSQSYIEVLPYAFEWICVEVPAETA